MTSRDNIVPRAKFLITHAGLTLGLAEWSARTGLPASTIKSRLNTGWSVERALTTKRDRRYRSGGRHPAGRPAPCPRLLGPDARGRAYCCWQRGARQHRVYLGPHGTAEAGGAYRRFAAEWAAGRYDAGAAAPDAGSLTVGKLIVLWLGHCGREYTKRGKPTSEVYANRAAMAVVGDLYGALPASALTVPRLEAARGVMVGKGWKRDTVNQHVARVQRMYSWGVRRGVVEVSVADALRHLPYLVAGRTEAGEGGPRLPVPADAIARAMAEAHKNPARAKVLRDMVAAHLATGMRPGELCTLTRGAVDTSHGRLWRYEVTEFNKLLHAERTRVVWIGPEAQAVLRPYLDAAGSDDEPLFRFPPYRRRAGWTPVTRAHYCLAIAAACKRAGVEPWNPHRLRHNKATEVMRRYEDDRAVGAAIGDSPEVARQVYADRPGEAVAKRIALETG